MPSIRGWHMPEASIGEAYEEAWFLGSWRAIPIVRLSESWHDWKSCPTRKAGISCRLRVPKLEFGDEELGCRLSFRSPVTSFLLPWDGRPRHRFDRRPRWGVTGG